MSVCSLYKKWNKKSDGEKERHKNKIKSKPH